MNINGGLMKSTIFFSLLACLLFTAIAESQDFGTLGNLKEKYVPFLEKLESREPSRRLLPMHPFGKGVEEHLKMREYSRLPLDRDFEGKMISGKSPEALAQGGKFTDERLTTYQHRPSAPQIPKGSIPTKVELTDSVQEAWVRHYASGNLPSDDRATAMAVDASGNTYVTGYSWRAPYGDDYLTAQYDASGNQVWAVRYDAGPNDMATAIAVDAAGNVYVTGQSIGSGKWADYATIKYNASGIQQWVARYNGPGNGGDGASAIAVDAAGNVYVTGYSSGSGTLTYYATIKYNASGIQQWVALYNGPGNSYDGASAIAVDGGGNVYVTGTSSGSGTSYDYATIKYNASGVQQWVARYDGPRNYRDRASAIAVDAAGNVYVTGESRGGTSYDYATIKYNASGVQQWVARYKGSATAIAVDAAGNVYVTGTSYGGTSDDYATIKYSASGAQQWVARYDGSDSDWEVAIAIAVDSAGNVYVTGYSVGSGTSGDYATIKYNASGIQQWVARYNGPGNGRDEARAIAVDAAGNVYVTGTSYGSGTSYDYATIKYSASGAQQWVARYNEAIDSQDYAFALTVDATGNVYVTGTSHGGSGYYDYATIKYNASGVQQWVARYDGPRNDWDAARAIAVDAAGNVYVTGESWDWPSMRDYATIKYNASGVQKWVARYNGPGGE